MMGIVMPSDHLRHHHCYQRPLSHCPAVSSVLEWNSTHVPSGWPHLASATCPWVLLPHFWKALLCSMCFADWKDHGAYTISKPTLDPCSRQVERRQGRALALSPPDHLCFALGHFLSCLRQAGPLPAFSFPERGHLPDGRPRSPRLLPSF